MSFYGSDSIESLTLLACELADLAASETLPRFKNKSLTTDNKLGEDAFDPVTQADRGAEAIMRNRLSERRPDDGVFGEEQARKSGTSGLTWVLDPIDGTRAFISGLPTWGTLIALDDGSAGKIGVVDQPYLGERYVGVCGNAPRAVLHARGTEQRLETRRGVSLASATVFTTDPYLFQGDEVGAFASVRERARLTRYGTDCYAYALLAAGQVDVVIESGLQAYDIAALVPLIRAAGGVVSSWDGGDCRWGGQVVAAGSAELHAEVLELLRPAAGPAVPEP